MEVLNKTELKTFTGAEVIVNTLKNLGVDTIFGYPGGVVLDIYDELFKQNSIKHCLVRHEQAAVHAAEGYARVSGKCGVVIVTSGPGAANTVSGIANAYMDGYPLIVLTGQVFKNLLGKDAFQEIDIVGITKSCTKAAFQVADGETLEETIISAYNCAMSGKKGPVVIDLVRDIFTDEVNYPKSSYNKLNSVNSDISLLSNDICLGIVQDIALAKRPVIVSGGGVTHSKMTAELFNLVKAFDIPVVTTMMGLGTYNKYDENYLGMIGLYGDNSANSVLRNADLILSLGARFNDRITCCLPENKFSGKLIQIDINGKEKSRVLPEYKFVRTDIKQFIPVMNNVLKSSGYRPLHFSWKAEAIEYKSQNTKRQTSSKKLQSYQVIREISDYTKDMNLTVTTEVGQHQLWTVQNYDFTRCGQLLTSGGSGTMGFGFPAAIGACIALNNSPVICISGDGSFQMNEQELAVCAEYNLPVKIFILNNGHLGMVRQLQQKQYGGRYYQTGIFNPDFVKLAAAYGIPALDINTETELKDALIRVFTVNSPYLLNINVEPEEIV